MDCLRLAKNAISPVKSSPPKDFPAASGHTFGIESGVADDPDVEARGQWGHKAEFVLSCIGFSVGLGNVWRFPTLAYENGGAAFMLAYLILQLIIGKPLYLMELIMGQFSSKGPTKVWDMNPAAKGIGISMCLISLNVAIYYNVIISYTIFYFFSTWQATLPWTVCKEEWNDCRSGETKFHKCTANLTWNTELKECLCNENDTINRQFVPYKCTPAPKSPSELFFYREVIQLSSGLEPENIGKPVWKLALCLLFAWILVCICLVKGIKSSGKVVYFSATFPYIVLLILLVRGLTLEGAIDGVKFFVIPKWDKFLDATVWANAAGQMFFSLSLSFGGILMYASYNKFKNKVYGDAVLISSMDLITSIIAGFVVFPILGHMAFLKDVSVDKVVKSGYGLAFVAYPEVFSSIPPPHLWSLLFFFMLFTLGIDSEFALMETTLTCFQDEFPHLRKYKSQLNICLSAICYFVGLSCVTNGGDYVVTIMDYFAGDSAVLLLSCFETVSVMWVYGIRRFLKDTEYMLGSRPRVWRFWAFHWTVTAPILTLILFLYRMIKHKPLKYSEDREFPVFAQVIGWLLMCTVLFPVPAWFASHVYCTFHENPGMPYDQLFKKLFEPTPGWGPSTPARKRDYLERFGYEAVKESSVENGSVRHTGPYSTSQEATGLKPDTDNQLIKELSASVITHYSKDTNEILEAESASSKLNGTPIVEADSSSSRQNGTPI